MNDRIEALLARYYEGETTLVEERELKRFFSGDIPEKQNEHYRHFNSLERLRSEEPRVDVKQLIKRRNERTRSIRISFFSSRFGQLAAAAALLTAGFAGGYVYNLQNQAAPNVDNHIAETLNLNGQETQLAGNRLQVVNALEKRDNLDDQTIQLLINTLNFDPNVNVRLAASQALLRFSDNPLVVESFIQSLPLQTDPMMQITLIEALVDFKEQRAIGTLERLAKNADALEVVREKALAGSIQLIHQEKTKS